MFAMITDAVEKELCSKTNKGKTKPPQYVMQCNKLGKQDVIMIYLSFIINTEKAL